MSKVCLARHLVCYVFLFIEQLYICTAYTGRKYFVSVFVEGDFDAEDVFCASWTVVIVTAGCFVFLQFCILVVCVLCICASRRSAPFSSSSSSILSDKEYAASSSVFSTASRRPQQHIHHQHVRSPPLSILGPDQSFKSLRTSLRD